MNIETTIDNAIRDFSVSGDAMRWTGESPEAARMWQTTFGGPDLLRSALDKLTKENPDA